MRAQVFDEAWRELDRWFADPRFHGRDWKALHDRYRPLALAVAARRDFDDVVNMMLGELNASHMGFRPPAGGPPGEDRRARGSRWRRRRTGTASSITEVLPDTPAARVDANLTPGRAHRRP